VGVVLAVVPWTGVEDPEPVVPEEGTDFAFELVVVVVVLVVVDADLALEVCEETRGDKWGAEERGTAAAVALGGRLHTTVALIACGCCNTIDGASCTNFEFTVGF